MRGLSSRALHERIPNLLFVRAAVEDLPAELAGAADHLSVVLPWGGLLAAVARPEPRVLRGVRALCRPAARLEVLLCLDPVRDRIELARLGLASRLQVPPGRPLAGELAAALAEPYAQAGFRLAAVRGMGRESLGAWPSTWARRLSHASGRTLLHLTAVTSVDVPNRQRARTRMADPYNGSGGPS